jgi:N utilization substance protein A
LTAGTVEITSIAREPGSRTKIVVATKQVGLDPVGAVVGQRGARVQAVVEDLGGEKIDIIAHTDDAAEAIGRALSPAPVVSVTVDEASKSATVVVPERALSLAIGAGGQNARLAARLTGFRIDIASDGTGAAEAPADAPAGEEA